MRIGLISDTHIPDHAKELPDQLKDVFCGVDLILHAGDIYEASVLDELECLAPVLAAEGDDDPFSTRNDRRVKREHILNIEGVTIRLIHERPYWTNWYCPPRSKGALNTASFQPESTPDIIISGHTHNATIEEQGSVLLVNPGSLTFPHYKVELGTVALLTVSSGKAEAQIVQLQ